MRKIISVTLLAFALVFSVTSQSNAREWSDLHEEDNKLFGSEKEMKYNPDMFFIQRENWQDHYSCMMFWMFKYTDYPKYSSLLFLPFYYGLDSKIDNRSLTFIPLTLTYWETDGNEKFRINPLFVSGSGKHTTYEESYSFSLLHGYLYNKQNSADVADRTWWLPIVPVVYRSSDRYGGHMNFLWLLDYSWDRKPDGDENIKRFWLMPFLFHRPGDDGYTNIFPPVFLYNRHSNGEYWLSFLPLFLRSKDKEYRWAPDSKSSYVYEDTFASLIYYYNDIYKDKWGGEIESTQFWFPLLPLFYSYNKPGTESHRNLLWIIDWHNNAKNEIDRFWIMPILFHEPGDNGYTHSLPPIFLYNRHSNGEYWMSLLPLFIRSKDKVLNYSNTSGDKNNQFLYEDLIISPLLFSYDERKGDWNGEKKSSLFWFPILPLFYSYSEPGVESHRNVLWVFDWHNNAKNETDRFWFTPVLFHESGDNGYTHVLPPLFLYNRHSNGEYWLSLLPLFLRSRDKSYNYSNYVKTEEEAKSNYLYEDLIISPLFYSSDERKDNWNGELKSSTFWFPIIPLYYSHSEPGVESHRNLLGIIDWHNNAKDETDRLWLMPAYFGGDTYRHILPPLYISVFSSDDDYYRHLLPLFVSINFKSTVYDADGKNSITRHDRKFFTPLSGYSAVNCSEGGESLNSSAYWFPLLPLYYHSEDKSGSHTNLLWAIDWEKNSSDELSRFWLLPFIFHQPGEGGYRYYFPIFFRPGGWTEKRGVSYSPLYYHNWSETEDIKWSWLVHYTRSNNVTGDYMNMWLPFYYHHNLPAEGETTWAGLVYYHHNSLEHNGYFARIAAPLYWNFETKKRDTTLFLPLYFETTKKNGSGSFYLNILGWTKTIVAGTNPLIDAGLGFNKKGMYIDVDGSWLYDMFSIATRVTIPMKNEKMFEDEEPVKDDAVKPGEVKLSKKLDANRESSFNFWGFHFFYGLVAYQQADTRKHFRLLPLSYITWDDTSENKVKWILNYMSYKQDETEYLVFFPFYAYQQEGKSYSTGYLLNAYWHEYDDEKQLNEYTVLWPFFNMYSSPAKSGWRLLPLVWHKNRIENNLSYTSTITPLFMDWHDNRTADDSTAYRLNFSPLHFYRYNEGKEEKSKLWFSLLPFIFYKQNETTTKTAIISSENSTEHVTERQTTETRSDTLHWFFPAYYTDETEVTDSGRNITTSDYTLIALPLVYYHSETEQKTGDDSTRKKKGSVFVMGYYKEFSSEYNSASILFGLYKSESYPENGGYMYKMFYGLFNVSDINGNYQNYFRPFYYYGNDHGTWESSMLMGLWGRSGDDTKHDSGFSMLYSLFRTSLAHYDLSPYGKSFAAEERETWLAPLFYYSDIRPVEDGIDYSKNETLTLLHYRERETLPSEERYTFWAPIIPLMYHSSNESRLSGRPYSDSLTISPLYFRHKSTDSSDSSLTLWAPILPLFYYGTDSESTHTNILLLADYESGKSTEYTRFWLTPLIYSKTGSRGYFHLTPLYMSWWDNVQNDYTYLVCGLYLHNTPSYSRQNFLYLYDHKFYNDRNYDEYSFLLSTIEYKVSPEVKKIQALWGLLADAEWNKRGYEIEGMLYLAAIKRDGENFHSRVLPFWWYESDKNSHTLVIPPALTWDSKDVDKSRFQLWLAGLLWYRNYDPYEKSDFRHALLGIPYYKTQKAERGYESVGSLWGLLWEYETESETGFSKFSLLKFMYKRVEMNGEVTHKVLGISF